MASKHGQVPIVQLSDAVAIGYSGSTADTTTMFNSVGQTGRKPWIEVYAKTAISIASGEYWYIEFQAFSADTAASAVGPFTNSNSGGVTGASGTAEDDAHQYLLHKTSADGALAFSIGDLICEFGIPEKLLRLKGYPYVQLTNITDKTDPGVDETIDVLVVDRG